MYDDSWYSYVPESKKDDSPQSPKHRRRESLLKQPNDSSQISEVADPLMEIFEENAGLKGPPKATLARRAKSYSDFYEAAIGYLSQEAGKGKPKDVFEVFENGDKQPSFESRYEQYENDILDASQEEYQLYRDQLALSERHLDGLLDDTTSALDLLATLSESFKAVDSQTTAFQAQCEDLLAEQKRLRDLANEVGTDLQYYAYLEPLTRRLNAPGAGRLVRSDDFLEMLTNLNTCIDFMDQHPNYRDSSTYKTRYLSLLQRSLGLVQMAFEAAVKEVSDEASKKLKVKDQTETTQYILSYGNFENITENLGFQIQKLLQTAKYAFGSSGDVHARSPYARLYHDLYAQITQTYLSGRSHVGPLVLRNLQLIASNELKPGIEFQIFARSSVQYVFEVCRNELRLIERLFIEGPILADYSTAAPPWNNAANYADLLEKDRLSHVKTLHDFLSPHLINGDLKRISKLVSWLETKYLGIMDNDQERDSSQDVHRQAAQLLLSEHVWPLMDKLFIKAAQELQFFKPSANDLKIGGSPSEKPKMSNENQKTADNPIAQGSQIPVTPEADSNSYPTVKTAIYLLLTYNESEYDRPKGDAIYEIIHQATESLQRAATMIKRDSGLLEAQAFLIKNLILIRNLFMTHEIPESVRQSAELDFTPIWETFRELQARKQLLNPFAYVSPLFQGQLLPAVVDRRLDARKELELVLVQQVTAFTKYWQSRLSEAGKRNDRVLKVNNELEDLLNKAFDETTKAALLRMIKPEQSRWAAEDVV